MATVIANFKPTTAAAQPYGYQVPSTVPNSDPLFPQWLCNVNLSRPPQRIMTTHRIEMGREIAAVIWSTIRRNSFGPDAAYSCEIFGPDKRM